MHEQDSNSSTFIGCVWEYDDGTTCGRKAAMWRVKWPARVGEPRQEVYLCARHYAACCDDVTARIEYGYETFPVALA